MDGFAVTLVSLVDSYPQNKANPNDFLRGGENARCKPVYLYRQVEYNISLAGCQVFYPRVVRI